MCFQLDGISVAKLKQSRGTERQEERKRKRKEGKREEEG